MNRIDNKSLPPAKTMNQARQNNAEPAPIGGRLRHWRRWACLASLALFAAGCSSLSAPQKEVKAEIKSLVPGDKGSRSVTPTQLQSEVMRFADQYVGLVTQAADDSSKLGATPVIRLAALKWKVGQATAAYTDAAGQNPNLNALDIVVLATISRIVTEELRQDPKFGETILPLLDVHQILETNAWSLVDGVLTSDQKQELRGLILKWHEQHPDVRHAWAARFREFAGNMGQAPAPSSVKATSIFSLLYLDPMAGLDPTARAIEETRQLAERMMYYAERAPALLSWQAELLTAQLADQAASEQVLSDLERISKAAEIFGGTAERLPQVLNDQRDAAIQQLFAGVATERSNILASLASEEKKMRDLLAETRSTLNSGSDMANSLNAAIKSLDAFVHYVSPPETNQTAVSTNSPPFNVLDYGTAATQVGAMAKDLNTLLTSVNQSTSTFSQIGLQATTNAEHLVKRAFWLGLVLVVFLLAGAVGAGLAYRSLANKFTRQQPETAARDS